MPSVPSRPMTPEGSLQDALTFPGQAYGATLGLVYYRALGDPLRAQWDAAIDRRIDETRTAMSDQMDVARRSYITFMQSGDAKSPALQQRASASAAAQLLRQKLDFLMSLKTKKTATFPNAATVNDVLVMGQNPWCLSDSEFYQAVSQEVGATNPQAHPSFNYGLDGEARETSPAEMAAKLFQTALNAKMTSFLDDLMEIGEKKIAGLLASGMQHMVFYVVRKVPIADMLVDVVSDMVQDRAQGRLVQAYRTDRERRLWLKTLSWGLYQDPPPASRPGANDFKAQVIGGP